jgi:hypothetical protein
MQGTAKMACIFNARNYKKGHTFSMPILVESDTNMLARPNGIYTPKAYKVGIETSIKIWQDFCTCRLFTDALQAQCLVFSVNKNIKVIRQSASYYLVKFYLGPDQKLFCHFNSLWFNICTSQKLVKSLQVNRYFIICKLTSTSAQSINKFATKSFNACVRKISMLLPAFKQILQTSGVLDILFLNFSSSALSNS